MSRDHRKLRAFEIAESLVTDIYRETKDFPRDEWYGLRAQIRRASVSVSSNLVEGSARQSTKDYCNFCNIACGSAFEMRYLAELACRLGLLSKAALTGRPRLDIVCASLVKLVTALEVEAAAEETRRSRKGSALKPGARSPEPTCLEPGA